MNEILLTEKPKRGRPPTYATVRFRVEPEFVQKVTIPSDDKRCNDRQIFYAYPKLSKYPAASMPRSQMQNTEAIDEKLARKIKKALLRSPGTFMFENNGSTIACEHAEYNKTTQQLELTFRNNSGIMDGETTNRVLAKVQALLGQDSEKLERGRIRLEILVGAKIKN